MGQIKEISTNSSRIRRKLPLQGLPVARERGMGFPCGSGAQSAVWHSCSGRSGWPFPYGPRRYSGLLLPLAFARSNPHWADWIYRQPGVGEPIRQFLETGAMARQAKVAALGGMTLAATIIIVFWHRHPWIIGPGLGLIAVGAVFVITRKRLPDG